MGLVQTMNKTAGEQLGVFVPVAQLVPSVQVNTM